MSEDSGKVGADPLFVGLTRPPMIFGVSYIYFMLELMVFLFFYVLFDDKKKYAFIAVGIAHVVGFYLCSKEPLFLDLINVKMSKCKKIPNESIHGANSYDPR